MIKQVVLCLVIGTLSVAAGDSTSPLSFADWLMSEGEYYRAVTEYLRYLHERPEGNAIPKAKFRIGQAYLEGGMEERAEQALDLLISEYPESSEAVAAARILSGHLYRKGRYSDASSLSQKANLPAQDMQRFEAMCRLRQKTPPSEHSLLNDEWLRYQNLPHKSPTTAGILSAVLPGSGQLYTGRKSDALWAFLLNAVFGSAAVIGFENDEPVAGGFAAALTAVWYSGNIYNAVNGAHLENQLAEDTFFHQIESRHIYNEQAPLFHLLFHVEF